MAEERDAEIQDRLETIEYEREDARERKKYFKDLEAKEREDERLSTGVSEEYESDSERRLRLQKLQEQKKQLTGVSEEIPEDQRVSEEVGEHAANPNEWDQRRSLKDNLTMLLRGDFATKNPDDNVGRNTAQGDWAMGSKDKDLARKEWESTFKNLGVGFDEFVQAVKNIPGDLKRGIQQLKYELSEMKAQGSGSLSDPQSPEPLDDEGMPMGMKKEKLTKMYNQERYPIDQPDYKQENSEFKGDWDNPEEVQKFIDSVDYNIGEMEYSSKKTGKYYDKYYDDGYTNKKVLSEIFGEDADESEIKSRQSSRFFDENFHKAPEDSRRQFTSSSSPTLDSIQDIAKNTNPDVRKGLIELERSAIKKLEDSGHNNFDSLLEADLEAVSGIENKEGGSYKRLNPDYNPDDPNSKEYIPVNPHFEMNNNTGELQTLKISKLEADDAYNKRSGDTAHLKYNVVATDSDGNEATHLSRQMYENNIREGDEVYYITNDKGQIIYMKKVDE